MPIGKNKILELYPSAHQSLNDKVDFALCPFKIKIPASVLYQIKQICSEFLNFRKSISAHWEDAVLNSLDFHYSGGELKIIEANTNASGYLLSQLLLKNKDEALCYEEVLFTSFEKKAQKKLKTVVIADKNPESENMYIEFLMFKDFFARHGVDAQILATQDVTKRSPLPDLVYNRDTDFDLNDYPELQKLWQNNEIVLSTSPLTYQNLASKSYNSLAQENLESSGSSALKEASLKVSPLKAELLESLWSKRKELFFKPSDSFGSKGVYAGKSISHKKFLSLGPNYIAQELHPPGKVKLQGEEWKYDLRAFFSEGSTQKIIARVYRGQVTNFANLGGGFALVDGIE